APLVAETIQDMLVTTDHQIECVLDSSVGSEGKTPRRRKVSVKGDSKRVSQVLINLLSNAIKYSPYDKRVIVTVQKKDKEAVVGVKDFGIGIPKQKQSRIFQRYYRAHDRDLAYTGLGIGLYISYQIVQRHGGRMWVDSEEGKGSTFYFSLPLN
ncbi:MAG TPA: ATP-binding protein, partial [Candidatus Paceibacterota bacterium]|nr:ATP-binding protein [Candidatus Paceibacterota bacterium]